MIVPFFRERRAEKKVRWTATVYLGPSVLIVIRPSLQVHEAQRKRHRVVGPAEPHLEMFLRSAARIHRAVDLKRSARLLLEDPTACRWQREHYVVVLVEQYLVVLSCHRLALDELFDKQELDIFRVRRKAPNCQAQVRLNNVVESELKALRTTITGAFL
jgi:hypothetical protein